ncbi:MAG: hypothetical protein PHV32_07390 [Eubacteriales bacterium]|nr:hypothetical protein [Eubacteriales bacterium]
MSASDGTEFLKAEYTLTTKVEYTLTMEDQERQWIVYFLEEDGIYSSFAVRVNEAYDAVSSLADVIVQSYQQKS